MDHSTSVLHADARKNLFLVTFSFALFFVGAIGLANDLWNAHQMY